jgi:hypothetical protein
MIESWLMAILQGIGKVFLHPALYIGVILSLVIGYLRVRRERGAFNIRVFRSSQELRYVFPRGLLLGLVISLLTLGSGLVLPTAAILLIGAFTTLFALILQIKFLSPAYTLGLAFLAVIFLFGLDVNLPVWKEFFTEFEQPIYPAIIVLLGLLLIAEGLLIVKNAIKTPSPHIILSKRGQMVGVFKSNRVWMVPLFILIPGGELAPPFDWYPVFSIGEETVTPLLVPFLLGFSQTVQGSLPEQAISKQGRLVIFLGIFITALALAGHWYPTISILAAVLAIFGRHWISYYTKKTDRKMPFYFSQSKLGVRILSVIPGSPAGKMGLEKGEVITKTNGQTVWTEREFYNALQKNRAHCKLEVIGNNDQIRFVQRALFEGEHHELGIIFIDESKNESSHVV